VPNVPLSFAYHLLSRATFGRNDVCTAEIQQAGASAWLERQMNPMSIDDPIEATLPGIIDPSLANGPDWRLLLRAIYSRRQLAWRMVYFLNNHFDTGRLTTEPISECQEDDAWFASCFTTFATVLRISATSPAMIDFLDTRVNVVGNPNENYARELMELHTLGVHGGYTEQDVAQAARVFTGWSRVNNQPGGAGTPVTSSVFQFRPTSHDTGPKTLSIGWSTPGISGANGYQEGYSLLDFLAQHPSTALRFSTKLCQYFVADDVPPNLLAAVRQTYVQTGGNLRAMLKTLFLHPDFASPTVMREKVHDGFELIVNAARRLEVPLPGTGTSLPSQLNSRTAALGAQPHSNAVPTGYPEEGPPWQGPGNVLPRWTFADDLVQNRISGVTIPWTTIYAVNRPTNGAGWVSSLLARFVDGDVPPTTVATLTAFMNSRLATLGSNPTLTQVLPHLRDLASIVIRLPEAQLH
jgi:uncharacterized protein (DUF1800 family)